MTTALWIIAIVETIRMIEQSIQLKLIRDDQKPREEAYKEFIKSLKETDEQFARKFRDELDARLSEGEQ